MKPRKISPKTRLPKSIWQIFGSIRERFIRTFRERFTSSKPLTYPKEAVKESIGDLILARQILPPAYGYGLTKTTLGSWSMSITKRGKPLITIVGLSTASLYGIFQLLMEIRQELNGFKSSPKGASTSPQLTRKRVRTITYGLDLALRKLAKGSKLSPEECRQSLRFYQEWEDYPESLYFPGVKTLSESSKPTAGKNH